MKKFRLLVLAFAAMLAGTQAGVAQNWTGKTADDLKSATRDDINTDSEDANFFLYNVGTGKFLTIGGLWGTQAVLKDVGLLLTLDDPKQQYNRRNPNDTGDEVYSIHTKYSVFSTADNYIQLMDGSNSTSMHDTGLWYTDRTSDQVNKNEASQDLASFYFHPIADGSKIYNIYVRSNYDGIYDNKRAYLVAPAKAVNNTGVSLETTAYDTPYSNTDDKYAQWMLIPLSEVRANFQMEAANATEQYPADGSYIIRAQNFSRNNGDLSQWRVGNISDNNRLNTSDDKSKFPESNNYMLAPTENESNYYVGNGYYVGDDGSKASGYDRTKYYKDGFNSGEENLMSSEEDSHQKNYGGYWTANIKGPGTIWQQIYTPIKKAGW